VGKAISNTSPLLYLYRIGVMEWLGQLFEEVWVPDAVVEELEEGGQRGYDVLRLENCLWIKRTNPQQMPTEWFALDLGRGELAAMALGLEHPEQTLLLDDLLARRVAEAAGLRVWGTPTGIVGREESRINASVGAIRGSPGGCRDVAIGGYSAKNLAVSR